ncbi:hypothetical protein [Erwinia amylovora]|uniref:hypothetical protein n=1 Tax=Erwinia amylovora TaxID=552 RepID=UPI001F038939|nr:hypothetical protein [Erwinia amylovora]
MALTGDPRLLLPAISTLLSSKSSLAASLMTRTPIGAVPGGVIFSHYSHYSGRMRELTFTILMLLPFADCARQRNAIGACWLTVRWRGWG